MMLTICGVDADSMNVLVTTPAEKGSPLTGMMNKGMVFNIKKYALHDGPGIRTTVFLKGCPLSCWWCHNPEGIRPTPERIQTVVSTDGGRHVTKTAVVGHEMDVFQVMAEIEKDVIFYDESGGGATFSGGEPLAQAPFLKALLRACREREIHTAVDTSGHAPPEVFSEILALADLILYDLKVMDPGRHLALTGVSNHRVLANLRTLAESGKPAVLRFPAIPGLTDTPQNVGEIAAFVHDFSTIRRVSVLPYHRIFEGKYLKLKEANKMDGVQIPGDAAIRRIAGQFESYGFTVTVGG